MGSGGLQGLSGQVLVGTKEGFGKFLIFHLIFARNNLLSQRLNPLRALVLQLFC